MFLNRDSAALKSLYRQGAGVSAHVDVLTSFHDNAQPCQVWPPSDFASSAAYLAATKGSSLREPLVLQVSGSGENRRIVYTTATTVPLFTCIREVQ